MPDPSDRGTKQREPLSKERVLRAAVALADEHGIEALTMRALGQALGVEAMSLYNHVANKDAILDGIVEFVVGEIALPSGETDWKTAMRERAVSAREVFARHPWAVSAIESRTDPGPITLRYFDAVLGSLRRGGFSLEQATHASWLLDSYIYGFAVQERSLPFDTSQELTAVTGAILEQFQPDAYPYLVEVATGLIMQPGYNSADEFDFGLELILDGLQRLVDAS